MTSRYVGAWLVGSLGERLQREREKRSIKLEEIAEATKVGTLYLRAIEQEEFDKLPGGIFNKGYVRAYAHFLELDEEQAVADYLAASGDDEAELPLPEVAPKNASSGEPEEKPEALPSLPAVRQPWATPQLAAAILLAALGLLAWRGYELWKDRAAARASSQAPERILKPAPSPAGAKHGARHGAKHVAVTVPSGPASQPLKAAEPLREVPTLDVAANLPEGLPPVAVPSGRAAESAILKPRTGLASVRSKRSLAPLVPQSLSTAVKTPTAPVTAKSNGDAADPKGFVLRIRSKEDAWVMIVADGQQIMDGTLSASAEKQVRAHDKVVVRVGNAAAVDISYNGKPVPTIGNANEVKSVTFTQQGMEE